MKKINTLHCFHDKDLIAQVDKEFLQNHSDHGKVFINYTMIAQIIGEGELKYYLLVDFKDNDEILKVNIDYLSQKAQDIILKAFKLKMK